MAEPSSNWIRETEGYYSSVFGDYTYSINPVTGDRIIYSGTTETTRSPIVSISSSGTVTELSDFQNMRNRIGTSNLFNLINQSRAVSIDLMKSTGVASEETINSNEYKSSLLNQNDFLSLSQGGSESNTRPVPTAQQTKTTPKASPTTSATPTDRPAPAAPALPGDPFLRPNTILDASDPQNKPNKIGTGAKVSFSYPTNLGNNKQDHIKFEKYEYKPKEINTQTTNLVERYSGLVGGNKKDLLGTVRLPIQPSITDSNTINWGNGDLNPLQAYAASLSITGQQDITGMLKTATQDAQKFIEATKVDPSFATALRIWLASEAVGINGLLPRLSGAVVNPNLELLFQGPQLRPFNFTFKLSPRDEPEAKQVKSIIRFFKQGMAVQKSTTNLFLKAPDIFQITYIDGTTGNTHSSLNMIKTCALLSASVDYTPDGSYMTFNDNAHTMTSYQLTLAFSEIDPVYNDEYNMAEDVIGY